MGELEHVMTEGTVLLNNYKQKLIDTNAPISGNPDEKLRECYRDKKGKIDKKNRKYCLHETWSTIHDNIIVNALEELMGMENSGINCFLQFIVQVNKGIINH